MRISRFVVNSSIQLTNYYANLPINETNDVTVELHCKLFHSNLHCAGAPVAFPLVWNKFTPSNIELMWNKQIFNPSITNSVHVTSPIALILSIY